MDRSERALSSLLGEEEPLRETWRVDTVTRGFEFSPPGLGGSETVGLTDQRLVWLDDELETVDLADVTSVGINSVGQSPTSMLLVVGPIAVVFGVITSLLLWLFTSLPSIVTLAPVGLGVLALVAAFVGSRFQDPADVERQYYLDVKTVETTIQVYATESTVRAMNERVSAALE
ncbi:hypothetical protein HLRTI_002759 [Halorhabdus tiamatea SARL4B]|uniref:Uncharacterized protein n=1 Tax=Halorhabdus tiamatea SARL4B TaxID=1033806 RepID=F7PI73_9EURY|nr:hypothetical protein [Halorhabdus tiamatea]ERJ05247.1 hypothetical protein HLRTI_002759 [Halorhabdus tiamatea SARL4B]CCQ32181.1 conserved hypothetical protein [Halorhabdus tiamatea SARL4B]